MSCVNFAVAVCAAVLSKVDVSFSFIYISFGVDNIEIQLVRISTVSVILQEEGVRYVAPKIRVLTNSK